MKNVYDIFNQRKNFYLKFCFISLVMIVEKIFIILELLTTPIDSSLIRFKRFKFGN